jgi:hypothetical protein
MCCLQYQEESAFKELVSPLEQRRRKFLKRRNEHGDRGGEVSDFAPCVAVHCACVD